MSKETSKIEKGITKKKVNRYTKDECIKEMKRLNGQESSKYYRDIEYQLSRK